MQSQFYTPDVADIHDQEIKEKYKKFTLADLQKLRRMNQAKQDSLENEYYQLTDEIHRRTGEQFALSLKKLFI